MKKINLILIWIAIFLIIDALISSVLPFGSNFILDTVKLVSELFSLILVIFVFYKIKKRDAIIFENKTIAEMIKMKDNSDKFAFFPVSIVLMIFIIFLFLCTLVPEAIFYFMKYLMVWIILIVLQTIISQAKWRWYLCLTVRILLKGL